MLYSYPILGLEPLSDRLIYLRTMLVGMESLKGGVTCVLDDVLEMPGQSLDQLGIVFQAYEDLGIRANCSGHIINKVFTDTIPYANEVLPRSCRTRSRKIPVPSTKEFLDFARMRSRASTAERAACATSSRRRARSAAPRTCSTARRALARARPTYHIHILETKVQASPAGSSTARR